MISIKNIILVILGSSLGGASRYVVSEIIKQKTAFKFPLGTFMVNLIGCFIIGIVYGYVSRSTEDSNDIKLLLATGFCGGFTTFSAFAAENMALLKTGNQVTAISYIVLSVVLGILATFLGNFIFK